MSGTDQSRLVAVRNVGLVLGFAASIVGVQVDALPLVAQPSVFLVICTGAVLFLFSLADKTFRIRLTVLEVFYILFVGAYLIAEMVNASDIVGRQISIGAVLGIFLPLVAIRAARRCVDSWEEWTVLAAGLVTPAVLVAAIAVLQIARVPGLNELLLELAPNEGLANRLSVGDNIRSTSTIGHWTSLGGYLCVAAALLCCLILRSNNCGQDTRRKLLALGVISLGQLTTVTFATIALHFVVVGITLIALRIGPLGLSMAGAAGAVAWGWFGEMLSGRIDYQSSGTGYLGTSFNWVPETIAFRVYLWSQQTIPAIQMRPWTGWGADIYTESAVVRPSSLIWLSPESEWMRTAVGAGLVVLGLQIALLISGFVRLYGVATLLPWLKPLFILFIGLLTISSIHSHLSNIGVPLILWLAIGALPSSDKSASTGTRQLHTVADFTIR